MNRRRFVKYSASAIGLPLMAQTAGGRQEDGGRSLKPTLQIKLTSLFVENQDEALEFYTNVLGFVRKQDIPLGPAKWLTVVSPDERDGTELLLEPNGNPVAKAYQTGLFEQGIASAAFAVDDVELAHETLVSSGVTFHTAPTVMGTTKIAVFDDTCGNLITLFQTVTEPDLSARPFELTIERTMTAPPHVLFEAWTTERFDRWFAAPGTVLMRPEVNAPFFFESRFDDQRHPHYGRFLRLVPDRLIEMTWITAAGTQGVETVVAVELTPRESGTQLRLTHGGFPNQELRDGHEKAWPAGLEKLDEAFGAKG